MRGDFTDRIRAPWHERSALVLRRRRGAKQLGRASLENADPDGRALPVVPDRFEKTKRPQSDDVGGVLGLVKGHANMRLRAEMVDLFRADCLDDASQPARVRQVAIMEKETRAGLMLVAMQMVDPFRVECR